MSQWAAWTVAWNSFIIFTFFSYLWFFCLFSNSKRNHYVCKNKAGCFCTILNFPTCQKNFNVNKAETFTGKSFTGGYKAYSWYKWMQKILSFFFQVTQIRLFEWIKVDFFNRLLVQLLYGSLTLLTAFWPKALRKLSFHSCLDCLLFRRLLVRSPAPAAVDVPVGKMLNPWWIRLGLHVYVKTVSGCKGSQSKNKRGFKHRICESHLINVKSLNLTMCG